MYLVTELLQLETVIWPMSNVGDETTWYSEWRPKNQFS